MKTKLLLRLRNKKFDIFACKETGLFYIRKADYITGFETNARFVQRELILDYIEINRWWLQILEAKFPPHIDEYPNLTVPL